MEILATIIYIIEIVVLITIILVLKKTYYVQNVNLKKKEIDVIDECMELNKSLIKKLTKILIIAQSEELAENKVEQIKEVIQSPNENNF